MEPMPRDPKTTRPFAALLRAIVEIAFILFLFYANLLMGEFNVTNRPGKTLSFAVHDILTAQNFLIGLVAACIGYVVFEALRKKL
jgi:hypothetical protein